MSWPFFWRHCMHSSVMNDYKRRASGGKANRIINTEEFQNEAVTSRTRRQGRMKGQGVT